jgi:ribosome-associated protein
MAKDLNKKIIDSLDDLKGQNITEMDVKTLTDVMDTLIIVTGTSNRHVKSLATNVVEDLKKDDIRPLGVEGMESGEWVLVDYGDTVVHVMLPAMRDFYEIEKLWSQMPENRDNADMPKRD